jgi:hypothetical protein
MSRREPSRVALLAGFGVFSGNVLARTVGVIAARDAGMG